MSCKYQATNHTLCSKRTNLVSQHFPGEVLQEGREAIRYCERFLVPRRHCTLAIQKYTDNISFVSPRSAFNPCAPIPHSSGRQNPKLSGVAPTYFPRQSKMLPAYFPRLTCYSGLWLSRCLTESNPPETTERHAAKGRAPRKGHLNYVRIQYPRAL